MIDRTIRYYAPSGALYQLRCTLDGFITMCLCGVRSYTPAMSDEHLATGIMLDLAKTCGRQVERIDVGKVRVQVLPSYAAMTTRPAWAA